MNGSRTIKAIKILENRIRKMGIKKHMFKRI